MTENQTCQTCRYNNFCEDAGTLKLSETNPDCWQGRDELDNKIDPPIATIKQRG